MSLSVGLMHITIVRFIHGPLRKYLYIAPALLLGVVHPLTYGDTQVTVGIANLVFGMQGLGAARDLLRVAGTIRWRWPAWPRSNMRTGREAPPTLVIWGKQDEVIPSAHAQNLPGAKVHVIANADSFERGSTGWFAAQFMKTNKIDGEAVAHVLRAQPVTPLETLKALATPVLVVCGKDDADNGSAPELAATLPHATYVEVPGNHMSAVTMPALGIAMRDFLLA